MTSRTRTKLLALVFALSTVGLTATVQRTLTAQTASSGPWYADNIGASQTGLTTKTDATAFGGDYLECQVGNPFGGGIAYEFGGMQTGTYELYATWKNSNALPTDIQFDLPNGNNRTYVTVDQTKAPYGYTDETGRTWYKLGTISHVSYAGAAGSSFYVAAHCRNIGGRFDALLAMKPSTVVVCGNGRIEGAEECDDRNQNDTDTCTNACKRRYCGDGIVNNGERCDQGAQNGVLPQGPYYWGGCTTSCMNTDVTACGNGYLNGIEQCDDGNTFENDGCNNNCRFVTTCGDGKKEGQEQCDDGNTNNNDACTAACNNAKCLDGIVWTNVEGCDDGNTINNDACSNVCTKTPVCGDGIQDYGEGCDDNNTNPNDGCTATCQVARCGDGVVRTNVEQCDDGNSNNSDSCKNDCTSLSLVCGNGIVQAGEQCDDGNTIGTDACTATCQTARCGDGVVRTNVEQCDDANASNNDSCTATCRSARCGDGYVQAGETCDDGNAMNGDGCTNACALPGCGDGFRQGSEQCDDGNGNDTDSCRNNCTILTVSCGNGVVQGSEQCDDGNRVNTDACTNACRTAICGDYAIRAGYELCDDGNQVTTDACTALCQQARCGDGIVRAGYEQCDDGNSDNNDACTNACRPTNSANVCGDGILQANEQCDDGNRVNTDTCTNSCQTARCGDLILQTGVELCDDGNQVNTDSCTNVCRQAACGDGFVRTGVETCDDGNTSNNDSCTNACVPPTGGSSGQNSGPAPAPAPMAAAPAPAAAAPAPAPAAAAPAPAAAAPAPAPAAPAQSPYVITVTNAPLSPLSQTIALNETKVALRFTVTSNQRVQLQAVFRGYQGDLRNGYSEGTILKDTNNDGVGDMSVAGLSVNAQTGKAVSSLQVEANTPTTFDVRITAKNYVDANGVLRAPQGPVQINFDDMLSYNTLLGRSTNTNGAITVYQGVATNGTCVNYSVPNSPCTLSLTTGSTPTFTVQGSNQGTNTPAPTALTIRNVDLSGSSRDYALTAFVPAVSFTATAGDKDVILNTVQIGAPVGNITTGHYAVLKEIRSGDVPQQFYTGRYWYAPAPSTKFTFSPAVSIPKNTTKTFVVETYTQTAGNGMPAFNPQVGALRLDFDTQSANYVSASTSLNGTVTQLSNIATNGTCGAASCQIAVFTGPTASLDFKHAGNLTFTHDAAAPSGTISAGTTSQVVLRFKARMTHEAGELDVLPFTVQNGQAVESLAIKIDGRTVASATPQECGYLAPYSQQERDQQGFSVGGHWLQFWTIGQGNPSVIPNQFCAFYNFDEILPRNRDVVIEVSAKIKPRSAAWTSGSKIKVSMIKDEHYLYVLGQDSMRPLRPSNSVTTGGNVTYTGTLSSNEHIAQ